MSATDLSAILPLVILAGSIAVILLVVGFLRDHRLTALLSVLALVASLGALGPAGAVVSRQVTPLVVVDGYTLFYWALLFLATIVVIFLSYAYLAARPGRREEFYLLLLLATLGAAALVASSHFASFFLGLETLSISLLGLIAYPRGQSRAVEAGVKYLILAGTSSALLLFGMALIYARLGSMQFARIAELLPSIPAADAYWLAGLAMLLTGLGFKLSLVPFHMWAPDVYEGAPAPVTAFVATISKGAVFALLLRFFLMAGAYHSDSAVILLNVIAILSMLAGNLLALLQSNVKRILAYSSIAHLGYLLVAFLAGGALAIEAVSYYLVAYFVMTLGVFGVVAVVSTAPIEGGDDMDALDAYAGLLWRRPWLAGTFAAMLLGLAGLPLTVGFLAKFYALTAGVGAERWPAVFALVVGSVIGLFYYLRIIVVMARPIPAGPRPAAGVAPWLSGTTLAVLALALVWLGVFPAPLLHLIQVTSLQVGAR